MIGRLRRCQAFRADEPRSSMGYTHCHAVQCQHPQAFSSPDLTSRKAPGSIAVDSTYRWYPPNPMTSTPTSRASSTHSTSSYLSYPVTHIASSLYRRLTEPPPLSTNPSAARPAPLRMHSNNGIYTPSHRTASPFQPPPLTPLSLLGTVPEGSPESAPVLTRALAEEIRLLVPPRLQLADRWRLVYNLQEDGVSLATLYNKCAEPDVPKMGGFVLVVRDAAGSVGPFPLLFSSRTPLLDASNSLALVDLRSLPNRRSSPLHLLLRHRGVFPLARLHPSPLRHPGEFTAPALSVRLGYPRPQHHDRIPHSKAPSCPSFADKWA